MRTFPMTTSQFWLVIFVALYMLIMLGIGFWTSTKIKNTKDYITAGGRLGWALSIGTLFATWFGAETCMGSSQTASEKGLLGVIADPFGAGACLILSGIFFAKFFHRMKIETVVDFFEKRYGRGTAWIFALLYIPVYLGWIGAQLLALGIILHSLTGLPELPAMLLSASVVVVYTTCGGMWADAVTDFYQMIFIVVGLLILFPLLAKDLGGWQALRTQIPSQFFHVYPHSSSWLAWLNYLQAWMVVGVGSLPAQDLFQRLLCPKSGDMARWSSIIAGCLYITVGLLPVFLGLFARLAFTSSASDSVLVDLALRYLPIPLMAILVGALLSAIMSSVDSALLAPAGIIGKNIVSYVNPHASESLKLRWCKGSIPLLAVLSLILALYFKNIYTLCTQSWGVLLVGAAAPMIWGVYWERANTYGAVAAAFGGPVSWILFSFLLPDGYPTNLLGFVVSCLLMVTVSLATQDKASRRSLGEKFETFSVEKLQESGATF